MSSKMNLFFFLVGMVIGFVVVRVFWWVLVQIPRNHAKDEAICEKCWGKTLSDDVTECMEWCDCPQRETTDKHED
jgi:high-affinity Fe2+/Pb2+ permease